MPNLTTLKCKNNSIEVFYPNVSTKLNYIDCSGNYITELVLTKLTDLATLICSYNRFEKGKFELPRNARFAQFEAIACMGDIEEIDLSASTTIKFVNVSKNASLKRLKLAGTVSNIQELIANDCDLESITCGSNRFPLFDYDNRYSKPVSTLSSLREVNVANNPRLNLRVVYRKDEYRNLRAIDVTGCDVQSVYLHESTLGTLLTKLCAGVPQRANGNKVAVIVFDQSWYNKWDEWKDYPENKFTTHMILYRTTLPYTSIGKYDQQESGTLETITDDDKKLREAMGETFYNHMKEKLSPDSRALHVSDVNKLTELDCANMDIVDLDVILKYMPKASVVNAQGNELKTVILKNLSGVDVLDLSNNPVLDSLSFNNQSGKLNEINLSHSFVNEYGLMAAMKVAVKKRVIADGDVGPQLLNVAKDKNYSYPRELSLVSNGRSYVIYNLKTDRLTIGGKSVKFFEGYAGSFKAYNEIDRLYLAESAEPIELIFNSADMALLWLNKWVDDNPGRKFTMKIETGDATVDNKLNSLLSLVNSVTKNGIAKLDDNTRKVANNYVLKYAWKNEIFEGYLFDDVLDEFGLHESLSAEDAELKAALPAALYEKLRTTYAPESEYLHVADIRSFTTLDCSSSGVTNLTNVIKYMPALKTLNASSNALKSVTLGANGQMTSVDLSKGTLRLDTLTFKNKVNTLDLSSTSMQSRVFEAAVKNTVDKLTVNGSVGITLTLNENVTSVKELVTNNSTLRLTKAKLQTLSYAGSNLYFNADMSAISITNLKLIQNNLYNITFSSADNALRFFAQWAKNNTQTAGYAPRFTITVGSNSNTVSLLSSYNTRARNANGFVAANKKAAITAIVTAVNRGYVTAGSGYDEMLNLLNEAGLADAQTTDDKALQSALGSTLYTALKNRYAASKAYLHVSDLKNVTTLDASRTGIVNLKTVLKYMPKVNRIYADNNDISSVDVRSHGTFIELLDLSYNTKLGSLYTKKNNYRSIDLSYSRLTNNVVKDALYGCTGFVSIHGNYGMQLVTLDNVTGGKLSMLNTNRVLQLNACTLDSLKFGGERLIFNNELSESNVKNLVLSRNTPMTVEFHTADAALKWIEEWYSKKPGAPIKIELKTSNASYNNTLKNRLSSINSKLAAGGQITSSIRTQLYNIVKAAVSTYGLPQGSYYGKYVNIGNKKVIITAVPGGTTVYRILKEQLGITLAAAAQLVKTLPVEIGTFGSQRAAEIAELLEEAGADVTVQ